MLIRSLPVVSGRLSQLSKTVTIIAIFACCSVAAAETRLARGRSYQGEWYTGNPVTYRIEQKDNNFDSYWGTMRFHSNGHVERLRIDYLPNGEIQVVRLLKSGNDQFFSGRPDLFEDPAGNKVLKVLGNLRGEGVGGADNEWGVLWIPQD